MTQTYVFGGAPAQPNTVTFSNITLSADIALQWPWIDQDTVNPVPLFLNITPTGDYSITMPDATGAGNGWATIFCNNGPNTVTVLKNDGSALTTIASGIRAYILVQDNSTAAGTWNVTTFGAGTSSSDAAALAGAGLRANGIQLQTNDQITHLVANYSVGVNDRAMAFQVDAAVGSGTLSLGSCATLGNGFWVLFTNLGTGAWTLQPNGGDTIDNQSSIILNPTESCMIVCDGVSEFATYGRGRSVDFVSTATNIDVSGNTDVTLSTTQAGNTQIKFIGALTGNINVIFPAVVGEWYINNSTTGSFSLTAKPSGGTGYSCPQGQQVIIKSDGTSIQHADTISGGGGGSSTMADGTTSAPGLAFANELTTGFSRPSSGQMSISVLASEVFQFTSSLITSFLNYTVKLVDAGAAVGPLLTLWRSSVSPAVNDILGGVNFDGMDSGGNQTTYGQITTTITDPTNGTEDGRLDIYTIGNGATARRASVGLGLMVGTGATDGGIGTIRTTGAIVGGSSITATTGLAGTTGTFSDTVAITKNGTALTTTSNTTGDVVVFQSTDASATLAPQVVADRFSASPTAGDGLGIFIFRGRNSSATSIGYGQIYGLISDATAGSEDGNIGFTTYVAGATTTRMTLGAGLFMASATGGDKGAGTINATNLYINGTAVSTTSPSVTYYGEYTANTNLTGHIAYNSSTPLSTDGNNIISISGVVVPSNTSTVEIDVSGIAGVVSGDNFTVTFFNGTTFVDARSWYFGAASGNLSFPMSASTWFVPGAAGTITININVGTASSTCRMNGTISSSLYGAKTKARVRVYG